MRPVAPCGSQKTDAQFDGNTPYPWITEHVDHDLDQQSRPVGTGYDMGCYELQALE